MKVSASQPVSSQAMDWIHSRKVSCVRSNVLIGKVGLLAISPAVKGRESVSE